MRRATAALLTAILAGGTIAAADHDAEFVYEPEFVQQDAFFHASTTPVGNLDAAALDEHVTWDADAPTSPVSSVYAMNNIGAIFTGDHEASDFFTASGTFTGDLDTLSFDLYAHNYAQSSGVCDLSLSFELIVDGVTLLSQDATGSDGIRTTRIDDTTALAQFTLTNIFAQMEEFEQFSDIEAHAGPDAVREVTVNVQNFYLCNEMAVAYDGVDHPSTIRANFDDFFHPDIDIQDPPPPVG